MKHIMLLILGVSFVLGFIASFWNEEIMAFIFFQQLLLD